MIVSNISLSEKKVRKCPEILKRYVHLRKIRSLTFVTV
jgi:hypothetical protein